MRGVIGTPEADKSASFAKSFGKALLECRLEDGELIPYAVVLALFGVAAYLVAGCSISLIFDPNAV
jgi:hypothetical protein